MIPDVSVEHIKAERLPLRNHYKAFLYIIFRKELPRNRSLFKEGRTGGSGGKLFSPNSPFRERKTPLRKRLTKIQLN